MKETGVPEVHEGKPFGILRTSSASSRGQQKILAGFASQAQGLIQKQEGWQQGRCICKHTKSTKSLVHSQKAQDSRLEWVSFGLGCAFYSLNLNFPNSTVQDLD